MHRCNGKHPIPWDFFNTFNNVSGKNLNWFWNNWFFTNYYIDLGIEKLEKSKTGYAMTIKNIGGFAAPVDIQIKYEDGSTETLHQTPAIWVSDQKMTVVNIPNSK